MPEDRKPEERPGREGASASSRPGGNRTPGRGAGGRAATPAGRGRGGSSRGGRTRPPTQAVVAKPRPWGLIAAAVAVVVFAAAVIGYAVYAVNRADADRVTAADQISGVQTYDYAAGQQHVATPVDYAESPPVGGAHDGEWADCTGTVYDVDIRHENAVHSLEHGGVWVTYDPDTISEADLGTLTDLVQGHNGMLMSPYAGLSSTISLQSWDHQLFLDSASDPRVQQFADFFVFGQDADGTALYPEPGASCENPAFVSDPLVVGDSSRSATDEVPTDAVTTPTPAG